MKLRCVPQLRVAIASVIVIHLLLLGAGCAFDRLDFSIKRGVLTPASTNVISVVP